MDELSPSEIVRRVSGNQPHPGAVILAALERRGVDDPQLAADLLDALNLHYELRPR